MEQGSGSRTVLVGVDGTGRSTDAIALGATLAPLLGAEPTLLHAHPYGELESLLSDDEHATLMREVAERTARDAAEHLGASPALSIVADRSPARALQAAASRDAVAAIVVGSSSRGAIGRVLPGGVAQRLLAGAPCPVAVAPAGYAARRSSGLGAIGVGFDPSADGLAALALAAELARRDGSTLTAVAVHQRLAFARLPAHVTGGVVTVDEELRAELSDAVHAAVDALGMDERATARLVEGEPADVLAAESERLGLLVVGSRGFGPAGAVLLGSVSGRLLRTSACPVMVVPRSAA